jgi:hypothetical protein
MAGDVETKRGFGPPTERHTLLAAMLREQGLEVEFSKYVFGCATGIAGRKAGRAAR